jgi:putative tryptophan/tyrosine transport system substrate-binding protein
MWYSAVRFVVTLTLGLLVMPLAAAAQLPTKVPRIGFVHPAFVAPCHHHAFVQGLRELGYVEGTNIVIEWRCAGGAPERQQALAVELVQLPVDVLVAGAAGGPLAAQQETRTIPIVFVGGGGDPIESGLVPSLARPGGNMTGVAGRSDAAFHTKRLELLLKAVPGATRIAVLRHGPAVRAAPSRALAEMQAVAEVARSLGTHLQLLEVDTPDDLEGAFAAMGREGTQALFMLFAPFFTVNHTRIVALAAQSRLPGIYEFPSYVEAGGLMSYNADFTHLYRRAAWYVDRILKGVKPADLPVERVDKLSLVINLQTAKALGLTIPPTLLFQADEVIR